MIARVYAKSAATRPQIFFLFALILAIASIFVALPIPQPNLRWIGVVAGAACVLFLGGFVLRHTLVVYEYQLYADRLLVMRHFLKRVRVTSVISHRAILQILPGNAPELRHLHCYNATVSFGGLPDHRFAVIFSERGKKKALLLECGYPFAKSSSKTVLEFQNTHKGE